MPTKNSLPKLLSELRSSFSQVKVITRSLAILTVASAVCSPLIAQSYKVTNLISDGFVTAAVTDPGFLNPWAMSTSGTWWISTANTGASFVVNGTTGAKQFQIVVPSATNPTSPGTPAGSITTAGATGMVISNGTKANFLFSTLDGTISGWNGGLGTAGAIARIMINNNAAGASYPGLATINNTGGSFLLVPNFGKGNAIEVYDSTFKPAKLAGTFTDPNLPAGYSPFGIHVIGQQIWVTYALRTSAAPFRTVDAPGNGVVSIFDVNGNFVARAVTGGNLNSPWGVAIAPANFGIFSNDLLIGNFGDGLITVYDPKTFAYLGQLMDTTGKSLAYLSLWELLPSGTAVMGTTATSGGAPNTVYFTAGLAGEVHGLLGAISTNTTVGTPTFNLTAATPAVSVAAGSAANFDIKIVPVNGFSGTVSLNCATVPLSGSCSFAPASVTVAANAVATATVTVQTFKANVSRRTVSKTGIVSAVLLPFASILAFRRRKIATTKMRSVRLLGLLLVIASVGGLITGCNGDGPNSTPSTPAGVTPVTVNAVSSTAIQQTTVALTVK
jgi:TIGR03118 family protein